MGKIIRGTGAISCKILCLYDYDIMIKYYDSMLHKRNSLKPADK